MFCSGLHSSVTVFTANLQEKNRINVKLLLGTHIPTILEKVACSIFFDVPDAKTGTERRYTD